MSKNTTSVLQPLDQGVIFTFKAKYKQPLVNHLLSVIKSHTQMDSQFLDMDELNKKVKKTFNDITLRDAFNWVLSCWKDTTSLTITNCFRKAGFDLERNSEDIEDIQT